MSGHFTATALEGALRGTLLTPHAPSGLGIVVLGGSSGSVDVARAGLFASRGAHAIAQQWFGGAGQTPGICEIPVEVFSRAVDRLAEIGCRRIAVLGTSKGAEGALLAAIHDPRIDVAVALSPTHVVWANSGVGDDGVGWPLRSSWTVSGTPVPFVSYDVRRMPVSDGGPVAYRDYHETSLHVFADDIPGATIAIERARAHVVLAGGGDDRLWPSDFSAEMLARRRKSARKPVDLVIDAEAGHRILLPGETTPRSAINQHGGTDAADARLGQRTWKVLRKLLPLDS